MSGAVISVAYVDYCILWIFSQSNIYKFLNYFKDDDPKYNVGHSKGYSMSEFLGSDIKTLYGGIFQFSITFY